MDASLAFEEPSLHKTRQIQYWTRCLKTYLPHHYTSNESNRMYLGFFIISALDLLGAWHNVTKEAERSEYVDWIYHCQHPDGGFRMWPGTDFGERSNEKNARWDPANMPATYFALTMLLITGDDFSRLKRQKTLEWVGKMQRSDGSFGETLVDGQIEGGSDPRFGYCATGVRYMLRGGTEAGRDRLSGEMPDINIDALVDCVLKSESYDGGFADQSFHEPHAGYTFCSLGALKFVHRLKTGANAAKDSLLAPTDPSLTLSWLSTRQTDLDNPDGSVDSEFKKSNDTEGQAASIPALTQLSSSTPIHQSPDKSTWHTETTTAPLDAGMNGRINKVADTCYAWWGGASFHIMEQPNLYDHTRMRRYLLGKTQNSILGGFGKFPDDLPDLYHSYMALAALGISDCKDVKEVDAGMCISKDAASKLPALWGSWAE